MAELSPALAAWETALQSRLTDANICSDIVRQLDKDRVAFHRYFHHCGTPSCLAGYMASMPEFRDLLRTDGLMVYMQGRGEVLSTGSPLSTLLFSARNQAVIAAENSYRDQFSTFFAGAQKRLIDAGVSSYCTDFLVAIFRLAVARSEGAGIVQDAMKLLEIKIDQHRDNVSQEAE